MRRVQHPPLPALTSAGNMLDVCLGFLTPCLIYLQGTNVDFLDLELWPHPLSLLFLPPKVALFRMQMYFFFLSRQNLARVVLLFKSGSFMGRCSSDSSALQAWMDCTIQLWFDMIHGPTLQPWEMVGCWVRCVG